MWAQKAAQAPRHSLSYARFSPRYVELVSAACTFEPHETFFSLFSDPRSTRLTRIHLREDLVQDQDLEAIRKQVRSLSLLCSPRPFVPRSQAWGGTGRAEELRLLCYSRTWWSCT